MAVLAFSPAPESSHAAAPAGVMAWTELECKKVRNISLPRESRPAAALLPPSRDWVRTSWSDRDSTRCRDKTPSPADRRQADQRASPGSPDLPSHWRHVPVPGGD